MTNALLGKMPDALGPTASLEVELNSLISRFGREQVREVAARLTVGKKGRKQERDWPIIGPEICRSDALAWIDGKDPFALRTNYSIAKDFVNRHPGQSAASTHRRIMRKLKEKRQWYFQTMAWDIGLKEIPFQKYFEILSRMEHVDERWSRILSMDYDLNVGKLDRYRNHFGEPDENMTMLEVDAKLAEIIPFGLGALSAPKRGIFGGKPQSLLSKYLPKTPSDKID